MKYPANSQVIEPSALRVGMFIHLEGGWLAHPFPLSSFKLSSEAQIATVRALGLAVRWYPDKSDPGAAMATASTADAGFGEPFSEQFSEQAVAGIDAQALESPQNRARRLSRYVLASQRDSQAVCERQFNEATQACRVLTDLVGGKPDQAREQAERLTQSLSSKMLGEDELCIRLLSENAGDKASAHAMNVTVISMLMGRSFGFNETDMLDLGVGAMLHDIGKLDLPERMRNREDHFSRSEASFYEEHVAFGVSQGKKMGLSPGALAIISQHHEYADGSGFPAQLNADRTTVGGRIVALVNRYDNLCNPNVMVRAVTPHEAVSLLFAQGKNKFDTAILSCFIKMMGVYPPGSTVQLTNDRYGLVVGVNASRPLKPRVLVHEPGVPRDEAQVIDLERVSGLGIRRSIKPLALPPESLGYLAPKARTTYFFESAANAESSWEAANSSLEEAMA
jgi:putative nucleotidyltransferase with HDIG domain